MGKPPGFVADKGFLMKIEISDHPQGRHPSEFQSFVGSGGKNMTFESSMVVPWGL